MDLVGVFPQCDLVGGKCGIQKRCHNEAAAGKMACDFQLVWEGLPAILEHIKSVDNRFAASTCGQQQGQKNKWKEWLLHSGVLNWFTRFQANPDPAADRASLSAPGP